MKILFQGDSITDAGRNYENIHDMGYGYAKFAAENITENFPDHEFEFINLGISGNRTEDLVSRIKKDFIDINPDIISIHIGINDTWSRAATRQWLSNKEFEANYRKVLSEIRDKTNAQILILEQYLLPVEDKMFFREDLDPKIQITRALAREFADIYVPLDGIFAAASVERDATFWAEDGVHPTENGAKLIAECYLKAIEPLIKKA